MKTISELLREGDPLRYEAPRGESDRALRRQAILAARPAPLRRLSRRTVLTSVAAFVLAGAVTGTRYWSRTTDLIAAVRFEVRLAETSPAPGLREATVGDRRIYLHDEVVVTNGDIAQARVVPGNKPETFWIALTFTPGGSAKMAAATGSHIDRPMAILIDGAVVSAPTVRSIVSTSGTINGDFSRADVDRIVAGIIGR